MGKLFSSGERVSTNEGKLRICAAIMLKTKVKTIINTQWNTAWINHRALPSTQQTTFIKQQRAFNNKSIES